MDRAKKGRVCLLSHPHPHWLSHTHKGLSSLLDPPSKMGPSGSSTGSFVEDIPNQRSQRFIPLPGLTFSFLWVDDHTGCSSPFRQHAGQVWGHLNSLRRPTDQMVMALCNHLALFTAGWLWNLSSASNQVLSKPHCQAILFLCPICTLLVGPADHIFDRLS